MKKLLLLMLSIFIAGAATAQVTSSGMNGIVTDQDGQPLAGATVIAVHNPSGTQYGVITNKDGRYTLHGLRAGGPYTVTFSYVGYQSVEFPGLDLKLGESLNRNAFLKDSHEIDAVVVTADGRNSAMNINRSGAVTSISSEEMALVPSVSRGLNDVMKLTPQASTTTSGLAIGGGNYRQSFVTIDGASFNNMFGIGSNLPAGGAPISLDALEQISVSVTPYDVRQSGFTGGAINAVTKSGTNELKISVYDYYKSEKLKGDRYDNPAGNKLELSEDMTNTLGVSLGTPIVKDKLFFFGNFEYEWNKVPGQTRLARSNPADPKQDYTQPGSQYNRPTTDMLDEMRQYLIGMGYDPGAYQGYSNEVPNWKVMARIDWNINKNHSFNVRFSHTKNKYSSAPSNSVSPLSSGTRTTDVYDRNNYGRTSKYAMYFQNSRYYNEQNFTSVAAELNSRFLDGRLGNTLRYTYSYQNEPRSYDGSIFPTVDILQMEGTDQAVYASFGMDPFTLGNLRRVSSHIVTDEVSYSAGMHHIVGGLQFEHDHTTNGYQQAGNAYYVYNSWDDFKNDQIAGNTVDPRAFVLTHPNNDALSQAFPSFTYMQYSAYVQDEIRFSERFRATLGVRLEVPVYPSIAGNENKEFTTLFAGNGGYKTSDMPKAGLNVAPRFGFNWDMTGDRRYILRGGTGIFTGRLPFVWIVSVAGNSNCLQKTVFTMDPAGMPSQFHKDTKDIINDLYGGAFTQQDLPAPQTPTILDKNLKMPSTWKTSLAFDAKLPGGVDFILEGIYNKDINSVTVEKLGQAEVVGGIQVEGEPEKRKLWASQNIKNSDTPKQNNVNPFLIKNTNIDGYYYSITAQAAKRFNFGLTLNASYTYSEAKNVIDGIGDQVTSAYNTNTFNKNGSNTPELGYSSYVSPHRFLASVTYRKEYGGHFGTSVALFYEAFRIGYIGTYSYSRYSYTMNNVTNDGGAQLLMYVPTESQWENMVFTDQVDKNNVVIYTKEAQKADFWAFVNEDNYLSKHKGEYTKRGGAVMPWQHVLNFKFAQDFFVNVKGKRNTITLGIDINNVGNLINKNWGNYQQLSNSNLLNYNTTSKTYQFNKAAWGSYASTMSTWSAMVSLRYTFN